MKADCERCGTPLPAGAQARVCSYECTFCPACSELMHGICPNCGGQLKPRL